MLPLNPLLSPSARPGNKHGVYMPRFIDCRLDEASSLQSTNILKQISGCSYHLLQKDHT